MKKVRYLFKYKNLYFLNFNFSRNCFNLKK
nr:MAG TPA: hypothetical protein [Caudoviricetes sp.]